MARRKPFHVVLDALEREQLATISANNQCSEGEAVRRCIRAVALSGKALSGEGPIDVCIVDDDEPAPRAKTATR